MPQNIPICFQNFTQNVNVVLCKMYMKYAEILHKRKLPNNCREIIKVRGGFDVYPKLIKISLIFAQNIPKTTQNF